MNGWNSLTKGTKQAEQPWLSCAVCFEALAGVVASGGACTSTMKATQQPLVPRILLQSLVGCEFGRRDRKYAHIRLERLASVAVTTLVWPKI